MSTTNPERGGRQAHGTRIDATNEGGRLGPRAGSTCMMVGTIVLMIGPRVNLNHAESDDQFPAGIVWAADHDWKLNEVDLVINLNPMPLVLQLKRIAGQTTVWQQNMGDIGLEWATPEITVHYRSRGLNANAKRLHDPVLLQRRSLATPRPGNRSTFNENGNASLSIEWVSHPLWLNSATIPRKNPGEVPSQLQGGPMLCIRSSFYTRTPSSQICMWAQMPDQRYYSKKENDYHCRGPNPRTKRLPVGYLEQRGGQETLRPVDLSIVAANEGIIYSSASFSVGKSPEVVEMKQQMRGKFSTQVTL
ncbi:hypothetical protein C8R43DRAFT_954391 [Mycena crocata]|nr:hypothetical protein C8R43DRAFT_954391 [Mycena crocata]